MGPAALEEQTFAHFVGNFFLGMGLGELELAILGDGGQPRGECSHIGLFTSPEGGF